MKDSRHSPPSIAESLGGFTLSTAAFGLTLAVAMLEDHNNIPDLAAWILALVNGLWLVGGMGWLSWRSRSLFPWLFPLWMGAPYLIDQNPPTWVAAGSFLAVCWVYLWRCRSRIAGPLVALAAAVGVVYTVHPPLLTRNPVAYQEYWSTAFEFVLPGSLGLQASSIFQTASPALWMLGTFAAFIALFTMHAQPLLWAMQARREAQLSELEVGTPGLDQEDLER